MQIITETPATQADIDELTSAVGHPLPPQYTAWLRAYGSAAIRPELPMPYPDGDALIGWIYDARYAADLHKVGTTTDPSRYLQVAGGGHGGMVALALTGDETGKVYFAETPDGSPLPTPGALSLIAKDWDAFLAQVENAEPLPDPGGPVATVVRSGAPTSGTGFVIPPARSNEGSSTAGQISEAVLEHIREINKRAEARLDAEEWDAASHLLIEAIEAIPEPRFVFVMTHDYYHDLAYSLLAGGHTEAAKEAAEQGRDSGDGSDDPGLLLLQGKAEYLLGDTDEALFHLDFAYDQGGEAAFDNDPDLLQLLKANGMATGG